MLSLIIIFKVFSESIRFFFSLTAAFLSESFGPPFIHLPHFGLAWVENQGFSWLNNLIPLTIYCNPEIAVVSIVPQIKKLISNGMG